MKLIVSDHAATRYVDRVKPHLSVAQGRAELLELQGAGSLSLQAPDWIHDHATEADAWLVLCDSIALPLVREASAFVATTVLTRAGHSEESRAYLNRIAAKHRHSKTQHRKPTRAAKKAARRKERRQHDLDQIGG